MHAHMYVHAHVHKHASAASVQWLWAKDRWSAFCRFLGGCNTSGQRTYLATQGGHIQDQPKAKNLKQSQFHLIIHNLHYISVLRLL